MKICLFSRILLIKATINVLIKNVQTIAIDLGSIKAPRVHKINKSPLSKNSKKREVVLFSKSKELNRPTVIDEIPAKKAM